MDSYKKIKDQVNKNLGLEINDIHQIRGHAGSTTNYKVKYKGETKFLKIYDPSKGLTTGPITKVIKYLFERGLAPEHRGTREECAPDKLAKIESIVLHNWEQHKVNAPKITATDYNSMVLMDFINGINYRNLIDQGKYTDAHHTALLENLKQIQETAKKTQNPLTLHNDFHIANFMYDLDENKAKAIDPGLVLNPRLNFKEVNAYLNLFFCYSLLSERHFTPTQNRENDKILADFLSILDTQNKQKMLGINKHTPHIYLTYQWLKKQIFGNEAEYEWFKRFGKDNFTKLNSEIKKAL